MAARALASVTVTFGMVSIPVKLYAATSPQAGISFNLLHAACGSRLKQQYLCAKEDVVVERADMVKGYEFAKDQYVIFTEEELKALEDAASKAIEITEFVPAEKVDPIYFEGAYYLGPDKGGERAYKLLTEALQKTKRAAVGQYSARGKQYLVLVRPMDGVLAMEQLHYPSELRSAADVPQPDVKLKPTELTLAEQLIEQSATDEFKPEAYHDQVRERVLEAIQQKVEGEEITAEPQEAPQTKIIDLMEALKASLAKKGEAPDERKAPQRAAATKSTKPARKRASKAS